MKTPDENFSDAVEATRYGPQNPCLDSVWSKPDVDFFRAEACHVLAHEFLERFPKECYSAYLIAPIDSQRHRRGWHIFVSNGYKTFDYRGNSEGHQKLVNEFVQTRKRKEPDWECAVTPISMPIVTTEFCEQAGFHCFDDYVQGDVRARARKFLDCHERSTQDRA